jgi:type VI secretion system secreted protein VgrG
MSNEISETTQPLFELVPPAQVESMKLTHVTGTEYLSRPFHFHLELTSRANAISPESVIGQEMAFSIASGDNSQRWFHGIVSSFARADEDVDGRRVYSAEVVPWLWLLTRSTDCRIFQNKDVRGIIRQVFEELGFHENSHFDLSCLTGDYPVREYCVQYRETAFNFVSRLMEESGMFYFFRFEETGHRMVFADSISGYETCVDTVDLPHSVQHSKYDLEHLTGWSRQHKCRTRQWTQNDYNFLTPDRSLLTSPETTLAKAAAPDGFECYDNPGLYSELPEGRRLTRIRMEAEEAEHERAGGTSTCRRFSPGRTFTLGTHSSAEESGREYVLTSVQHSADDSTYGQPGYSNRFRCLPSDVVFRPRRRASRPYIRGIQTARVVGPNQEEVHVDKFGRVKVKFHWDRVDPCDDSCSCWIRVAQATAGAGWGAHFWPRVGHEVVVAFVEGDPDRPLIVSSVYNGINVPPYDLPKGQTRSGYKSRSTPKGKANNFNELRFEDKKGGEQVYIHAERNLDAVVEACETRHIGTKRTTEIGDSKKPLEGGTSPIESTTVFGSRFQAMTGDDATLVRGASTLSADEGVKIESEYSDIEASSHLGKISLSAATCIELKVGLNSIRIDQKGVWINGLAVGVKGKLLATMHAPITSVTADGATTVNAPLTNVLSSGPLILKGAAAGMTY